MSVINQIVTSKDRIVEVIRADATQLPDECIAEMHQIIDDYPIIPVTKSQLVLYKLNEKISTGVNSIVQAIAARDVQIPTCTDAAIANAIATRDKKVAFPTKYTTAQRAYNDYDCRYVVNQQPLLDACTAIGIDNVMLHYRTGKLLNQIHALPQLAQDELDQANATLQTLQTHKTDLRRANAEIVRLQTLQTNRDQKADQFNRRTTELIALLQIPQTPKTPQNKQREKITRYKRAIVKALRYNRSYMDMKEKTLELLETYWSDTNAQHTVVEFDSTFNNHDEEIAHFEMLCDHYIESQNVDNSDAESVSGFSMASVTNYI